MKQHLCHVIDNRILWADTQLLTFDAPELARTIRPGQFALARDATTFDPYLRRTLWLYSIDSNHVAFTVSAHDPLAIRARVGDTIDLLAPIGHASEFGANAKRILLLGEGVHAIQLIASAHDAVAHGREVAMVVALTPSLPRQQKPLTGEGARFPVHLLSPEIEYRSEDCLNSELIAWADAIVASGSPDLYHALADAIRAARYRLEPGFAHVLIDLPMPCGTGACCACSVDTARGVKFACIDGPMFDLSVLENRRAR